MADPVWGVTSSSLSDEDTARMLCAFPKRNPLIARRRQLFQSQHQEQQCLYNLHDELNHEMAQFAPSGNSLLAFGYPSNGTYNMRPMYNHRDVVSSTLMDVTPPSTSCDDWYRQQQHTIQEQLEQHMQQQEIQIQIEAKLQRMKMQTQHQEQAERRLNRILQPQYSLGAKELHRTEWSHEDHISHSDPWRSHCDRFQETVIDRCVQPPSRRIYCRKDQISGKSRAAFASTQFDNRENAQGSRSIDRSCGTFARQQFSQSLQPPFHAPVTNPFHQWDGHDLISFGETLMDSNKKLQMRSQERYIQPQFLQPETYYPANRCQDDDKKVCLPRQMCSPDHASLNRIIRNSPTSSNSLCSTSRGITTQSLPVSTQAQIQTEAKRSIPKQIDIHSRPQVPASGAAVVPGVSLASRASQYLTIESILNSEDGPSKIDPLKHRPWPDTQHRALCKRKIPKKVEPVKRQKLPQQPKVRDFKELPKTWHARAPLQSESADHVSATTPTSKPFTSMYIALTEPRAARATDTTIPKLPIPTNLTLQSQRISPGSTPQLSNKVRYPNIAMYRERKVNNREMVNAVSGKYSPYATHQCGLQRSKAYQGSRRKKVAFNHSMVPQFEMNALDAKQGTKEPRVLTNRQPHAINAFNNSKDAIVGPIQRQESPPNCLAPSKIESRHKSSTKLDVVKNGNGTTCSKQTSRAKVALMSSCPPTASASRQHKMQRSLAEPSAAVAIIPTSAKQSAARVELPRSGNKTMVIFCKRDFMRYQAAKIWRKYQEQLEKHDEWREVRVAGKRTRYLHSRYDDEIRRTQKKKYTRSGRRQNYYSQHHEEAPSPGAGASAFAVGSYALRRGVRNVRKSPAREPGDLSSLTHSNVAKDECSLSGDCESDDDKVLLSRDASLAVNKHVSQINGNIKSVMELSDVTKPCTANSSTFTVAKALQEVDNVVSNQSIGISTSGNESNGVDVLPDGNLELILPVSKSLPKIAPSVVELLPNGNDDHIRDSGIKTTVVDEAPNNTIVPSNTDEFSKCRIVVTGSAHTANVGITTIAE
ncbi:hypothetical protein PsorP6_005803 [Peronosclerospora sorghi]|uniref:Uncharacterized protein n=1 Tax=Peronosclerospora sorghi TaxID=230839 RepID=A0ACC0W4I4_9STRA|nr:hypothetical protein PsorP6_005803 [Peronosclerospora sorghi]